MASHGGSDRVFRMTRTRNHRNVPARRSFVAVVILALLGSISLSPPAPAIAQQQGPNDAPKMQDRSEVIRKVLPSVVSITTRKDVKDASGTNAAGKQAEVTGSFGTGFVIDASGVIVTNYHVVKDAREIDVTFSDGTWVPARLLKATRLIDVALLKVDVGRQLTAVTWGDSEKLQVGQPVLTIGNALDVGISVSGGLVSALNRNIRLSPYDNFIQTDAAINHGNSGGPLVDMNGDVIGIDTAIFSPTDSSSGVGFAISSRGARIVIHQLMTYGWLRPGWIGVKVQQLTPQMSRALGRERADGSIVANVVPGGSAEAAGLRVGDLILRINDEPPPDERALLRAIAETPIGRDVTLGVSRGDETRKVTATVREWPRKQWETVDPPVTTPVPRRRMQPDLGIDLATQGDAARRSGVIVRSVAANTDAAERGLVAGDVILRVQDKVVSNVADARAAFKAARAEKRPFVLVLIDPKVHRTPGPEWVALRVAED